MFSWILIGLLVGAVMGLTGAGGALIAVPFLIHLAEKTIFEATLLSLIPVFFASLLNWFFQKKLTHYLTAVLIASFSFFGSFLFAELKLMSPPWVIQSTYLSLAIAGAILIWRKKSKVLSKETAQAKTNSFSYFIKTILSGFILGIIITMTGLGGGVLLTPWLHFAFQYPLKRAVATSLFTTAIASSLSFVSQKKLIMETQLELYPVLLLLVGIIVSSVCIKKIIENTQTTRIDQIRKWTYTWVVLFSIIAILLQ